MPDRVAPAAGRTLVIATGHALSLALGEGPGGRCLAHHHADIGMGHAEALMPAIISLLAPFGGPAAGISRVIVETGPGSFTGLRIGHAAASSLALAWGAALVGVRSTLLVAADAAAAGHRGPIVAALRAPRGQIWLERFDLPALDSHGPPIALAPGDAADAVGTTPAFGSGANAGAAGGAPRAGSALGLADHLFDPPVPLYVRPQDVSSAA